MARRERPFKGRQFTAEVILWAVRWYLQFPISYRDLELMLRDRGVSVDHTTVYRWIQAYAVELEKRLRPHLRPTNGSWRVDETYLKVKGRYLYRAVDSRGQTIDFRLSAKRDAAAAKRFFRKALHEIDRYLSSQSTWLVNYAERHRAGLRVGTSITEGTANFLVNRRMNKPQQMRWSHCGADLLLQCAIFNGKFGSAFGQLFDAKPGSETAMAA